MRLVLTILAFIATFAVVAVIAYFAVLFLAGPHGGVLPSSFAPAVLVIGWLCVIGFPIWAAWAVWRSKRFRR